MTCNNFIHPCIFNLWNQPQSLKPAGCTGFYKSGDPLIPCTCFHFLQSQSQIETFPNVALRSSCRLQKAEGGIPTSHDQNFIFLLSAFPLPYGPMICAEAVWIVDLTGLRKEESELPTFHEQILCIFVPSFLLLSKPLILDGSFPDRRSVIKVGTIYRMTESEKRDFNFLWPDFCLLRLRLLSPFWAVDMCGRSLNR